MWRVVALVALAGCTKLAPIPLEEYPGYAEELSCEYAVRCGVFGTADDCRVYRSSRGDEWGSVRSAVAAGIVEYDANAAADCLASYPDRACISGAAIDAACSNVFRGTVELGSTCALDVECESGVCSVSSCDQGCCTGTCIEREFHQEGEPCRFDADCARGLYCPAGYGGDDGTCRPFPAHGDSCVGEGAPCLDLADSCEYFTHTCLTLGIGGDRCETNYECSALHSCSAENRCALGPYFFHRDACTDSDWCASTHCESVCNGPYVCY